MSAYHSDFSFVPRRRTSRLRTERYLDWNGKVVVQDIYSSDEEENWEVFPPVMPVIGYSRVTPEMELYEDISSDGFPDERGIPDGASAPASSPRLEMVFIYLKFLLTMFNHLFFG